MVGGGLIIEANIPVQELECQRGEGAYFREDTVLIHSIRSLTLALEGDCNAGDLLPGPEHQQYQCHSLRDCT